MRPNEGLWDNVIGYESLWSLAAIVADATRVRHRGGSLFVELDDADKAAPWQPNP
jgi:hypothetical protein